MNRLLVSAVKTSVRTDSSVGLVSRQMSTTITSEVNAVTDTSATNVRVVRSFSSSACSSAVIGWPP
jgi:hypothetical protein